MRVPPKVVELTFMTILSKARFWTPPILWMLVIFSFSSIPQVATTQIYWQDFALKKTAHMIEYAVLAVLLFRALRSEKIGVKKSALIAFLFSAFYGMTDEFHQGFTPGREPHIRDVVFDTIGAGIGTYYLWKLLPKAPKRLAGWAKDFQLI